MESAAESSKHAICSPSIRRPSSCMEGGRRSLDGSEYFPLWRCKSQRRLRDGSGDLSCRVIHRLRASLPPVSRRLSRRPIVHRSGLPPAPSPAIGARIRVFRVHPHTPAGRAQRTFRLAIGGALRHGAGGRGGRVSAHGVVQRSGVGDRRLSKSDCAKRKELEACDSGMTR
jgi:hypothetical protein